LIAHNGAPVKANLVVVHYSLHLLHLPEQFFSPFDLLLEDVPYPKFEIGMTSCLRRLVLQLLHAFHFGFNLEEAVEGGKVSHFSKIDLKMV
jgi:hypothetical protein